MPGQSRSHIGVGTGGSGGRRAFEAIDDGRPPSATAMRDLRRLHAAAVAVVTTNSDVGFRGITVSAFCVVSLAPASVLICLATRGEALTTIAAAGRFAVNVLSDTQEFLAERFAGRAPLVNPKFEGVTYRLSNAGDPLLDDCLVWFDCSVSSSYESGDHTIVVGNVDEAGYGHGAMPLLYFDGAYHDIEIA
ncbi:MAG TPA: flavin reductase family protein [Chloroflexota bacterium]|nr:flavin reductase family protein [Chloroflexota bacterium]